MEYTITLTSESIKNIINNAYDEDFTLEQIEDDWDGITDYLDNLRDNGGITDYIFEDFSSVSDEWGITLFNTNRLIHY